MRAFSASAWHWLMRRLGVARGAPGWSAMPRCCDGERALPHARRAKHGATHARRSGAVAQKRMEARLLLGRGEATAARGASAVTAASPLIAAGNEDDVLDLIS